MEEHAETDVEPAFPTFGAARDRMWRFYQYGFGVEMFSCSRRHYGEYQEVNILHVSTYRPGAWPEILKILQYLNAAGFYVEYKQYDGGGFHQEWSTADVLLLGCDSKQMARIGGAMDEMERGLHGVLREWDVLWYFVDGHIPHRARSYMGWSGLCVGAEFSAEGIHMMRAHIRRRHDLTAQRGLFVTLEQWIADGIDRIVAPNPRWDNFGKKVDRLKKRIGTGGRDRDMFFAVTKFLVGIRNRSAHPKVDSSFERRRASYQNLQVKARQYGIDIHVFSRYRGSTGPRGEPSSQDRHVGRRSDVVWARIARAWLDDYYMSLNKVGKSGG